MRFTSMHVFFWLVTLITITVPTRAVADARVVGDVSNAVLDTLTLSRDGTRFVVVTVDPRNKGRRVMVDGKPMGKLYDSIAEGHPIFSDDGKHVAFVARLGQKCYVVHDGAESEGYPLVRDGWPIADLLFSPHGKYLAYKARVEGGCMQVVQGENFGPYEVAVDAEGNRLWGVWDFHFSQDGEHFAYRARAKDQMRLCVGKVIADPKAKERLSNCPVWDSIGRGTPVPVPGMGPLAFGFIGARTGQERVVLWNGKEEIPGKPWDVVARGSVVCPRHAPGGLDYVARSKGLWHAVIGGKEGLPYDEIGPIMYAPDGRSAYTARKGKDIMLVVQGIAGPPCDGIRYPGTVFSPDGKTIAYGARSAGMSTVIANGQPGPSFTLVAGASLTYSPDSKRLAYVAAKGGKRFVVADGKTSPAFEEVNSLRFSPDGTRLGYQATIALDQYVVVDGEKLGPFAEVSPDSPMFSNDGKHVAYAKLDQGQWQVILDGKSIGPVCEGIVSQLAFSKDNHLAYVCKFIEQGRPVFAMVVDGKPARSYDAIWMGDRGRLFLEAGGPEYFAKKGLIVYRVSDPWPK